MERRPRGWRRHLGRLRAPAPRVVAALLGGGRAIGDHLVSKSKMPGHVRTAGVAQSASVGPLLAETSAQRGPAHRHRARAVRACCGWRWLWQSQARVAVKQQGVDELADGAHALAAGAHLINDVSALRFDPRSLEFAANSGTPVVLMHAPGDGQDLHAEGEYRDVVLDVFDWLAARRDAAIAAGIPADKIVLDPGIGFGKSVADNLALLNALPLFHALGQPLLVGSSRKRMIGALSNEAPAHQRLGGSLALAMKALEAGVQLLRVHDVPETVQAVRVWRGLRDSALTDFAQLP